MFDRLEELYIMEKMGLNPFTSNEYQSFERKTINPKEILNASSTHNDDSTNFIPTPVKVVPNIYENATSNIEEATVSSSSASEGVKKDCKKIDPKISFSNNNKITQMRILKQLNKAR